MTTEVTKKQAILLAVLGIVLVIVVYVQFFIRPVLDDISASKTQAEELQKQYDDLVKQGESYDQNIAALEGWAEKNKQETSKLYPLCDPQRIDNIITRVVGMFDARITGLTISNLNQYYVDGEGNLITADPTMVEESQGGTTPEQMDTSAYTATGEYCRDFTYTIEGNYEDMIQLLNFVNGVSFLGTTNFTFASIPNNQLSSEEAAEGPEFTDNYSFTITITAYMYYDPLKNIESSDEDETESENENGTDASAAGTEV